jgi:UrcA family protein
MDKATKWLPALAAAAAFVVLSSPTIADEIRDFGRPTQARQPVDASDLDLSKAEDAQALYERIRGAAHRVCQRLYGNTHYVQRARNSRECVETAVESAVGRANQPLLTAIHEGAKEQLARL